jgi:hypothetical protein
MPSLWVKMIIVTYRVMLVEIRLAFDVTPATRMFID